MMNPKTSHQRKRDIILASVLFVLLGMVFIMFRLFAFQGEASAAHIYYGTSNDPLVTIDFDNESVRVFYNQVVPNQYPQNYPYVDENNQTITLLGDYQLNGVRQIVIIKYDFGKKSVEVIQESSPNKICSREGESTGWPLICLPNRIRIEFESTDEDFIL